MYNNHYVINLLKVFHVPCETKYSSKKALHPNFMIKNRYDIWFRTTKIMNWFAFRSGLAQLGFRFIFGSWSTWNPALGLARVILVLTLLIWLWSNTDGRYEALAESIDLFPPKKCCEHSRVVFVGWKRFLRILCGHFFFSWPYLWKSDRIRCYVAYFFCLNNLVHSKSRFCPLGQKQFETAVNKLPVRLQLAPQHEKGYGTCGNDE